MYVKTSIYQVAKGLHCTALFLWHLFLSCTAPYTKFSIKFYDHFMKLVIDGIYFYLWSLTCATLCLAPSVMR